MRALTKDDKLVNALLSIIIIIAVILSITATIAPFLPSVCLRSHTIPLVY